MPRKNINIDKQIAATRKDIEKIKAEFQHLISAGISATTSQPNPVDPIPASNQQAIIKSYDLPSSSRQSPEKPAAQSPPKRNKCYNKEETKAYMKKQKEKRCELQKSKKKVDVNQVELKKQKLQELQQKANELVIKNVQTARARSKSRESRDGLRIDRAKSREPIAKEIRTARDLCVDRTARTASTNDRSRDVGRTRPKSREPVVKQDNLKADGNLNKATNVSVNNIKPVEKKKHLVRTKLFEEEKLEPPTEVDHVTPVSNSNPTKSKKNLTRLKIFDKSEASTSQNPNLLQPPNIEQTIPTKRPFLENITTRSLNARNLESTSSEKIQIDNERNENISLIFSKSKPEKPVEYPSWLQENAAPNASPYNFINTVKRKLDFVSSKLKATSDVAVQNSLRASSSPKMPAAKNSSSPKLNLDPAVIERLELRKSESESDTSKNIPDISSESGTSIRKNAASVRNINTDKLDLMRLEKASSPSSLLENKYNESFEEESRFSRASIIVRNVSAYNTTPETVKSTTNINSEEVKKNSSLEEINSAKVSSEILSERSLSSVKTLKSASDKSDKISDTNTNFKSTQNDSIIPLKEPRISLRIDSIADNISLNGNLIEKNNLNTTNEIHLKFEAEIHLLNDFNESVRQLSAVEKAFESLKTKNRNTQTSIITRHSSSASLVEMDDTRSQISSINYSRGTEIHEEDEFSYRIGDSLVCSNLNASELNQTVLSIMNNDESQVVVDPAENGVSLLYEQMIKEEDHRLENLKYILKIREKTLLDRTRTELAILEMQKKNLKENGKLHEASLVKKKQRGILLKHQQERYEMQRLKQMQRNVSNKRITILKEQRNVIKAQLSTDKMLPRIKKVKSASDDRRKSGPLKGIIQSHVETSRRSSTSLVDDALSVTSQLSIVEKNNDFQAEKRKSDVPIGRMKRTLLMREAALQKRKREVEEVLRWHRKLLEDEKRVTELEETTMKIVSQTPASIASSDDVTERKVDSDVVVNIPEKSDAISVEEPVSIQENYTSDFEGGNTPQEMMDTTYNDSKITSISDLIDKFSRIQDELSSINIFSTEPSQQEKNNETVSTNSQIQAQDDLNAESESTAKQDTLEIEEKLEESSKLETNLEDEITKLEEIQTVASEAKADSVSDVVTIEKSVTEEEEVPTVPPTEVEDAIETESQDQPSSEIRSKEIDSLEEKEEDSLIQSEKSEEISTETLKSPISSRSSSTSAINVKKRVSEIMAEAKQQQIARSNKSPRMQDLYITTYDVVSPTNSSDLDSPPEKVSPKKLFGTEAEELLKKQLAVEQEIKQLEQQQKEQAAYVFMREIPNKPPPPYTPPSSLISASVVTVLPTSCDEIDEITKYSAKILHKAYMSNNLENVSISENTLNLITNESIGKDCYKFVFDICKEIAQEHYRKFELEKGPCWLRINQKPSLAFIKPFDLKGLEKFLNEKLNELFGFKKKHIRENAIIKWSRKKRDQVDEILILESQAEEADWINLDRDELLVIDEVTNDIMKMLLKETADVFTSILAKKSL